MSEKISYEQVPTVDAARAAYREAILWWRALIAEAHKIYGELPKQEGQRFWEEEVIPRLNEAKDQRRSAAILLADALEAEYAVGADQVVPAGEYRLRMVYAGRQGLKELSSGRVRVYEHMKTTRAQLNAEARAEISMIGLHNEGFIADEDDMGEVLYELTSPTNTIHGRCFVQGGSGHIMSRYLLKIENL